MLVVTTHASSQGRTCTQSDFLSQWLAEHTVIQHRALREALLKLVQALLSGGKLSLTQLGRYRAGEAYPKHQIKAADRLLGNVHL
jgi:hypothetical protein